MARDSVVKNFKVERTIDHGMLEGRGTENPNWIRDEVAEGHRQIKIREIKDSAVTKAADPKGLSDEDIDPVQCDDCELADSNPGRSPRRSIDVAATNWPIAAPILRG